MHTTGGPGVGLEGAGAGHGGMGGLGEETDNGGMFHGLTTDPTDPGSNGKFEDILQNIEEETIGGGVLYFEVSKTTTIDGKV